MSNLVPPPPPLVIAGASRALTDDALSALMHSTFHASPTRATTDSAALPSTLFAPAAAAATTASPAPADTDADRIPAPSSRTRKRVAPPAPAPTAPAPAPITPAPTDPATPLERPPTPTEDEMDALEAEEIHTLAEVERAKRRVAIKTKQYSDLRTRLAAARKLYAVRQRQQREERVRQLVEEKRQLSLVRQDTEDQA